MRLFGRGFLLIEELRVKRHPPTAWKNLGNDSIYCLWQCWIWWTGFWWYRSYENTFHQHEMSNLLWLKLTPEPTVKAWLNLSFGWESLVDLREQPRWTEKSCLITMAGIPIISSWHTNDGWHTNGITMAPYASLLLELNQSSKAMLQRSFLFLT